MNLICLACQKLLSNSQSWDGYHLSCSKKLFGTAKPPKIPFNTPDISVEAQKMVGKMSISGVQPKLSVIHELKKHQLVVIETGGVYILKPQTDRFKSLPENENLCMCLATAYGLNVPPHGLLPLQDGRLTYVVKRFDRMKDGTKLQQEDFQQLLQTDDKYNGSYEKMANFIKEYSDTPGLDLIDLFERALLFFVLGNGDAHLKNFSLIKEKPVGYHLSPAYDIVNSRLVMPAEREEMCLSLQGKKNRLAGNDFLKLSKHFGLKEKQVDNAINRLINLKPSFEAMIEQSFLDQELRDGFREIFNTRVKLICRP